MDIMIVLAIAVSLSMDAFSLSLSYGTIIDSKKQRILLSLIVGLFHFCMPLIGMILGKGIFKFLNVNSDFIVFLILFVIGVQMIFGSFKDEEVKVMKISELLLFGFAVSIDSFSVGFTLTSIYENYIVSAILFSICSSFFTFVGLYLGNIIKKSIGDLATILGGVILIIIGVFYLI